MRISSKGMKGFMNAYTLKIEKTKDGKYKVTYQTGDEAFNLPDTKIEFLYEMAKLLETYPKREEVTEE